MCKGYKYDLVKKFLFWKQRNFHFFYRFFFDGPFYQNGTHLGKFAPLIEIQSYENKNLKFTKYNTMQGCFMIHLNSHFFFFSSFMNSRP
jgi:hypothetical protein